MDISGIRLLGILFGVAVLIALFVRLRSRVERRISVWLLLVVGLSLLLLGAFPGLATLPSQLLELGDVPAGRIITVLLFSSLLLWMVLISERSKTDRTHQQLDRLVRQLAHKDFEAKVAAGQASCPIVILIPAYNEAENLEVLLPQVPASILDDPVKVVVIDDGSSDATQQVAEANGALVARLPANRGGGAALRTGYDAARMLNASVVVTMDADGQHSPAEIEPLVAPIHEDIADIVVGSRILGSCDNYSTFRWLGVVVFSRFISLVMGIKVTDSSSGFRAFRFSAVEALHLTQDQYHTAELIIEGAKRGLRIVERPVHIAKRLTGTSKKGGDFLYGFRFLRTVIKTWWR